MLAAARIAEEVRTAIAACATSLRPDVLAALDSALARERDPRGRQTLAQLLENARIAREDGVPVCQDTGTVWVRVELGVDECLTGDLQREVDAAVRSAYRSAGLRMSVVRDAILDRANTDDNTPAFIEISQRPGSGATINVMLKGGGSDNASVVAMLAPGEGEEGVVRTVLDAVRAKGAAACPPLLLGVGVGSTFDKVAGLAKRALLRPVGAVTRSPETRALEERILTRVNDLGIGPGGFGGDITALAVHVVTAPCHIASLPVAVNMGCSAVRSASFEILP